MYQTLPSLFAFFSFILTQLILPASSHGITVRPYARECFHEELHKDDRMTVNYQTDLGGDQLIEFWLIDPINTQLHEIKGQTMGEHSFVAQRDGKFTYCFFNPGLDGQDKVVSFNVHGVVYVSQDDPEHQDPLEREIRELNDLVAQIKDEQEYIVIRERMHRNTSESTNARVKWWSIGQTILLIVVCLFQVFYLKRFFEVKVSL